MLSSISGLGGTEPEQNRTPSKMPSLSLPGDSLVFRKHWNSLQLRVNRFSPILACEQVHLWVTRANGLFGQHGGILTSFFFFFFFFLRVYGPRLRLGPQTRK